MNIYLSRHADPDYENDSLTERGFAEAEDLATYLAEVPFTHIFASPLGRAQRTMEPTARGRDLVPVTLDWLRELRGDLDGHAAWNVPRSHVEADAGVADEVARVMGGQRDYVLGQWHEWIRQFGYEWTGGSYRRMGGAGRPHSHGDRCCRCVIGIPQ